MPHRIRAPIYFVWHKCVVVLTFLEYHYPATSTAKQEWDISIETDLFKASQAKHLTSGDWLGDAGFIFCCAMKRMREFVSGEPRAPMLDFRLAFSFATPDLSVIIKRKPFNHQ